MRCAFCSPYLYLRGTGGSGRVLFRSLVRTILQTGVAPTVLRATPHEKGDPLCSAQSDELTQKTKGGARGPAKCHAEAIGRRQIGQAAGSATARRLRPSSVSLVSKKSRRRCVRERPFISALPVTGSPFPFKYS